VIILTTFKLHTIFYTYTSLSDKYCEQEMCNYKCRKFYAGQCFSFRPMREFNSWDSIFLFRGKGLNSHNVSINCKEMCVLYAMLNWLVGLLMLKVWVTISELLLVRTWRGVWGLEAAGG